MNSENTIGRGFEDYKQRLTKLYDEREAEQIVRWVFEEVLEMDRAQLITDREKEMDPEKISLLKKKVERLEQGEPVQYVVGEVDFLDCKLKVDKSVLIPRPETEELARKIIQQHPEFSGYILDVGTGSGCLAIALAKAFPKARVNAWEYYQDAMDLARKNAEINGVNISFHKRNILDLTDVEGSWDMIVCNPPYVLDEEKSNMHSNVLGFEPPEALFVPNDDPLLYFKAVVHYAIYALHNEGWLYFEINERFGDYVRELLMDAGFREVSIEKDLNGKDRFAWGKSELLNE